MSELTYTVLDASDASLNKTATIIAGEKDAIVVDTGFTRADGHRIVAAALDANKTITAVIITAGDPDYYFGAEVIADTFPNARFIAPRDVIDHIEQSYEEKLQAWAGLGENLPTRLVHMEPFDGGDIDLEGHTLNLRRAGDGLGDRSWYLYDAETGSVVGGILLFDGLHVWTADTGTVEARKAWLDALDDIEALQPQFVVAGHRTAGSATDLSSIHHTREYLRFFEKTIAESADAAAAEEALLAQYPEAGSQLGASLGTKVAKGEMAWG